MWSLLITSITTSWAAVPEADDEPASEATPSGDVAPVDVEPTEAAEGAPADVDCSLPPVSTDALAATIGDATGAFAGLDIEGFEAQAEMVWRQLPCVSEPLTPLDVADVYKLRALDAFLDQDEEVVSDSLEAALDAAPGYSLPASIAPEGHPLQVAFDAAATASPASRSDLPVPNEARLLVDGQPVLTRPDGRAVLLQLLTIDGAVAWTSLVDDGEPVPAYETLSDEFREKYLSEAKVIRVRPRRPVELVVASSVAIVGAGAMYGLSRSSRATFFDPQTPYEDLAGLRARTNGLQTAAVLTGVAGLGLGATAVVTW